MTATRHAPDETVWLTEADCRLDEFVASVEQRTDPAAYPHAGAVEDNFLVYDAAALRPLLTDAAGRRGVQAELVRALLDGPGLVLFKAAFVDLTTVDRVTAVFTAMIAEEKAAGSARGDHFAKPGANDRVWNALEKLAVRDPDAFAAYYANDVIALASSAWLGPNYQITSAVNVVNPGGEAQTAHRDYHLGFQSNELAAQFPAHVHRLSPALTLQGAIAHTDMPVETGPTMYLPYSQRYEAGYLAWRLPAFRAHFEANRVQPALAKGDIAVFNPALFHAAGHNRSADVKRMANLLQVSSAFGRAMESVDRERMANALFPTLRRLRAEGAAAADLHRVVAACADGYSFPTNLDRDQPIGGLAPETQAEILWRAVDEQWDPADLRRELRAYAERRQTGD